MNPYLSAILTIAGLVLLFVLWIFYENRKIKNNTLERIRRNWGKPSKRQYEAGDLEQISHYFRRKEKEGFVIDDITWNDLDMKKPTITTKTTQNSTGNLPNF